MSETARTKYNRRVKPKLKADGASDEALNRDYGIRITSGYRTPNYNATPPNSVGDSKHLWGDAVDLAPTALDCPWGQVFV